MPYRVENILGKGIIARYKQFLLFSQYFPQLYISSVSNAELCGNSFTFSHTSPAFYVSAVQVFLKHCGKRRNCSLRAICPFPTVFSNPLENIMPFSSNLKLSSANSFKLEESKICRLGKGQCMEPYPHLFFSQNMLECLRAFGTYARLGLYRYLPGDPELFIGGQNFLPEID